MRKQIGAQSGIQVEEKLLGDLPSVWVDSQQLQQVLLNLCQNGVQAMPEGGVLTISSKVTEFENNPHVQVSVVDTGQGVESKDLPRLFTPFFTTKESGTGLGLATSKRIVDSFKGHIQFESHVGKGTMVQVLLPVLKAEIRANRSGGMS